MILSKKSPIKIGAILQQGMSSSLRVDWATPIRIFEVLNAEFSFTLDACADESNHKCRIYFSLSQNSLEMPWSGRAGSVWLNPPYGRQIGRWIEKAWLESELGATVVLLIPARTDTSWWHDYCMRGEVRFLRGRLNFDDKQRGHSRCPFPSAIVIFRGRP